MPRALLLLPIGLLAATLHAQNAYISQLDVAPYAAMGQPVMVAGYVRNASGPAVTSFQVNWRWRNGPVQNGGIINLGPTGLSGDNMAMFRHHLPLVLGAGEQGTLKVWVEAPGDPDRSNDTVQVQVTALDRWVPKRQLLEVRTSLACHNCLRAHPRLNEIAQDPGVVVAKYHFRDALTEPEPDAYFERFGAQGTPAGVIDHGEYGAYLPNPNHSQWPNHLAHRAGGASPVVVWTEPLLDTVTNKLHVTVGAEFVTEFRGDLTVSALIMRNNMYAPWEAGNGDPWNHRVVQTMLGGPDGDGEVIPNVPQPGTTYKVTWDLAWPEGIDPFDVCVVAFVTHHDRGARHALNAQEACVNRGRASAATSALPAPPPGDLDQLRSARRAASGMPATHRAVAVVASRERSSRPQKGAPRA